MICLYREISTNYHNLNSVDNHDGLQKQPAKRDFYFYQGD